MKVHYGIEDLPTFKNAALTIGTFDGVHAGHLKIINQVKKQAMKDKGESVIITFDPHPRLVIADKVTPSVNKIALLNTLEEKIELIEKQGIDHLVVIPFTHKFSEQTAEEYILFFLVDKFHPKTIITGYDHHFGKDRRGNYHLLEAFADKCDFRVIEIPPHVLKKVAISSTMIRQALLETDVKVANEYLGYDYFMEGKVIEGDKKGRTIGYPTANIRITDAAKLVPADGVYIVAVEWKKKQLQGMMNIGFRPTVGHSHLIEVNIFDFDEEIYGDIIKVTFKRFLRKERKFKGLDQLKKQLSSDERASRNFFSQEE